ncbi:lysophospholipid acyltransferase family protein [Thiolapillus brandeum]|uniref:Lipid A biosynthesis lauroyl acyltransferase n=1 Tax=Thiolapillus brandeum TaxID=1076588 RepID=A0A7U6GJJ0_9GAMM|nr:lysophospholipid acyltransferase family protein [Thiolapillus brandeum]BAO44868.1 lipid A biosynthesis lauroyl acyltransferase [Thiolapillus brandeum]
MRTRLLRYFIRFLSLMPLPVLRGAGRGVGWLAYRIPNRERDNARVNIDLCFPELNDREKDRLWRATLKENAITLLEMPSVWYGSTDAWLSRLDMGNVPDQIRALMSQGKGVVVAMPHLGNFEISAHFFGSIGKATGLYRPPRKEGLESVMLEGRNRPGQNRMVPTDRHGIKALYEALGKGELIVILPDQQPKTAKGGGGVFAPFFGVPALTMTLVNRFARKTGAPVYFISFVRTGHKPEYKVIGHLAGDAIADQDAVVAATELNAGVEKLARQYPAQYQWTYRRFQAQPDGINPYRSARKPS